jgi:hypothetical protein
MLGVAAFEQPRRRTPLRIRSRNRSHKLVLVQLGRHRHRQLDDERSTSRLLALAVQHADRSRRTRAGQLFAARPLFDETELAVQGDRRVVVREHTSSVSLCRPCVRAQSIAAATRTVPTPRPRQSSATIIPISPYAKLLSRTKRNPTRSPAASATSVRSRSKLAARFSTSIGGSAAIPSRSSATAAKSRASGRRSPSSAARTCIASAPTPRSLQRLRPNEMTFSRGSRFANSFRGDSAHRVLHLSPWGTSPARE